MFYPVYRKKGFGWYGADVGAGYTVKPEYLIV